MSTVAPITAGSLRPILPSHGNARVKSVLSGDTVILLGKATTPDGRPPEVVFTFEKVSSPR
jgi:staphylococcal nuclease domain-containing protein 1